MLKAISLDKKFLVAFLTAFVVFVNHIYDRAVDSRYTLQGRIKRSTQQWSQRTYLHHDVRKQAPQLAYTVVFVGRIDVDAEAVAGGININTLRIIL